MAKKLHKVDVDVKLLRSSQGSSGHGEFLIQEKNKVNTKQDTATQDVDLIFSSNGIIRRSFPQRDPVPFRIYSFFGTFFSVTFEQNRKSRLNSFVELFLFTFFSIETCPSSKLAIRSKGSCRPPSIDPTARSPIFCAW